ncbi:hypothetical protein MY11210_005314 [Beauveria gryllotalpidicola]
MANTFHPFSRLPPELRKMIWKMAVWNRSVSSANFFTILPAGGAYLATSPRVRLGPPTRNGNVCYCGAHGSSWECTMGSGCMVDSGLWEACQESRALMKFTYPTAQQYDGKTATGLATDQRGVTRRYTFMPSRDLLVLGTENFITAFRNPDREIDCVFDVPRATNSSVVSPFSVPSSAISGARGTPRPPRLSDIRRIAVALDPDWGRDDVDAKPETARMRRIQTMNRIFAISAGLHYNTIVYLYRSDMGHAGIAEAIWDENARFYTEDGYY